MFLQGIITKYLSIEQNVHIRVLKHYVHFSLFGREQKPMVVCALDSVVYNCGFADRLRGMISGYAYAKINNLPFKIVHKSPFLLEEYLSSNTVNWSDLNDLTIDYWHSDIVVNLNTLDSSYKLFKHLPNRPLYLFTNNNLLSCINQKYGISFEYNELFNELFQPVGTLKSAIDECLSALNGEYVSISFRFINLLGDAFEGTQEALPVQEREQLISNCIQKIEEIHRDNSECHQLLVTADSMVFLERVKILDYVYIVPGKTGHSGTNSDSAVTLKTFLDFWLISQAKKVYLIVGPGMYNSHFAKSAAQTQNKPFERIDI